jgi:hypothetical protein
MYQPSGLSFQQELEAIAQSQYEKRDFLELNVLNVEPKKPRDGMVIVADGTNFDPGSGAGVYARISGAWVKL